MSTIWEWLSKLWYMPSSVIEFVLVVLQSNSMTDLPRLNYNDKSHILSAYYMPGNVLNNLYVLSLLTLMKSL